MFTPNRNYMTEKYQKWILNHGTKHLRVIEMAVNEDRKMFNQLKIDYEEKTGYDFGDFNWMKDSTNRSVIEIINEAESMFVNSGMLIEALSFKDRSDLIAMMRRI